MRKFKEKKFESKKQNPGMFIALSRNELNFVKGGDQVNSEKREDQ